MALITTAAERTDSAERIEDWSYDRTDFDHATSRDKRIHWIVRTIAHTLRSESSEAVTCEWHASYNAREIMREARTT